VTLAATRRALVVGGGLAGAVAALELAARGVEVTLVRAAPGATALSWGTLDLAAASPLRRGGLPLRDAGNGGPLAPAARLRAVSIANPAHPYATVFRARAPEDDAKQAVAALDAWLAPEGVRVLGSLEQTRWLADVHGALRAADHAFTGSGEGDLTGAEEIALVELPGLPGFDPGAALRVLAAELAAVGCEGASLHVTRLELPDALRALAATPARLARALEEAPAQDALRDRLAALGGERRVLLFPPVLGLDAAVPVRAAFEAASGARVAELVGSPTLALAGYRLDRALGRALERAGVAVVVGRVARLEADAARVRRAVVAQGVTLECDVAVLATGRFVGGGVVERDGGLVEPLLGLPLYDVAGRRVDGLAPHRLVRRDYEGEQPLFAAGVRTDTRLRPLGADGKPRFANLFAAGDLLGSFDPARDRTGLGVALLTGRRAGEEAASC
jgi:glycerol-3-phosphate dehydrogenase subunit B